MSQPFWLDNLVAYSFQIALLVIAGVLLPFFLRLRSPGPMLLYWQILLGICLLLPAIQPWKAVPVNSLIGAAGELTQHHERSNAVLAERPPTQAGVSKKAPVFSTIESSNQFLRNWL